VVKKSKHQNRWIKIHKDCVDSLPVLAIANALSIPSCEAFVALFRIWSWADTYMVENIVAVPVESLDAIGKVKGIGLAMESLGMARRSEMGTMFPHLPKSWKHSADRKPIPKAIRKEVLSAGRCANCGSTERLTVDHKNPVSNRGSNNIENLQCLCFGCNSKKGKKLGQEI